MKNVILASVLAFGVSAMATETTPPPAKQDSMPAASAPSETAPAADKKADAPAKDKKMGKKAKEHKAH